MSTSASPLLDRGDPSDAPAVERRKSTRHTASFRPCCIISNGKATIGLMRNFSANGAQIEAEIDVAEGDEVSYFWEVRSCMRARIVWTNGKAVGLEHISTVQPDLPPGFPQRPLRVPCEATAQCFIGGKAHTVTVQNISEGGIGLRDLPQLKLRSRVTVEICGVGFSLATVCWQEQGATGLRLSKPMTQKDLARLLTDRRLGIGDSPSNSNTKTDPV